MRVERARTEESDDKRQDVKARSAQISSAVSTIESSKQPNQGAFSKFLDSTKQNSPSSRPETDSGDSDSDSSVEKSSDAKSDEIVESKSTKRDDEKNFSDQDSSRDQSAWSPAHTLTTELGGDVETSTPPARSILHIADLERIVSAVRTESFADSKEVTIDLKNSVLDGLRIKLTLTEQGTLRAEFLALNEQIKKQMDARKNELHSVLKDRSIKCGELKISVVGMNEDLVTEDRRKGPR